ncbi:hypothetical protein [Haladaptatus salinisoli]|nr:hypothetical protein [Haladaptatus salinisoli]
MGIRYFATGATGASGSAAVERPLESNRDDRFDTVARFRGVER